MVIDDTKTYQVGPLRFVASPNSRDVEPERYIDGALDARFNTTRDPATAN
jgi:hypothetical protein